MRVIVPIRDSVNQSPCINKEQARALFVEGLRVAWHILLQKRKKVSPHISRPSEYYQGGSTDGVSPCAPHLSAAEFQLTAVSAIFLQPLQGDIVEMAPGTFSRIPRCRGLEERTQMEVSHMSREIVQAVIDVRGI